MKILKLTMKGFKSFTEAELDLSGATVHVFRGPNGAGKSTIAQSIETALTGRNAVSTKRGGGLQNCITHGEKAFQVVLKTTKAELDFRVQRSGGKVLQKDGQAVTHAQLAKRTGIAQHTWEALFHSGGFLELSAEEFKSVVADHLGISFSSAQLFDLLEERGIDVALVRTDLVTLCQRAGLSATMKARDIETVHQVAYDFRRDVGRDVRHYEAICNGERPMPVDVQPLQLARRTLDEERSALRARLQVGHDRRAVARAREDLEADVAKAKAEWMRLEEQVTKTEKLQKPPPDSKKLTKAREAVDKVACQQEDLVREEAVCDNAIIDLQASTQVFADNPTGFTCKTCGSKITKAAAKKQVEKHRQQIDAEEERLAEIRRNAKRLASKLDKAAAKRDELEKEAGAALAVEQELIRLRSRGTEVRARWQELLDRLEAMPEEAPADDVGLQERISEVDDRIATLDNEIHEVARLKEQAKAYDVAAGRLSEAQVKHEVLDELVKFLSPKGQFLQDLLASDKVVRIEAEATAALQGILGIAWILSMEDGLKVFYDGAEISARLLSSGQRKVVDLVCKHAFAKATGLRTVVLDNAELLDPDLTEKVCEFLQAMADVQECVLVFTTRAFPTFDGCKTWRVAPNSAVPKPEKA